MASRSYTTTTGMTIFNGDLSAAVWNQVGVGLNNTASDYMWHGPGDPQVASFAIVQANDNVIPLSSVVSSVNTLIRSVLYFDNTTFSVVPYIRYNPGGAKIGTAFSYPLPDIPANYTQNWATDPNNATWTVSNFFTARFGVYVDQINTTGTPAVFFIQRTIVFTLPAPTATTNAASLVTATTATLNGNVDPNTATSTYPVQYRFEYGPTTSYGTQTALAGPLTGSGGNVVSTPITGLTNFSTYHYRVVASNADNTVNGNDQTFTTGNADRILMAF